MSTLNPIQALRVGLFFILGLGLIWIVYETLSESGGAAADGYTIKAPFDNLQQLQVGDEVRLAGVKIGNVSDIELEDGRGVAVLRIKDRFKIAADAHAIVAAAGLLGNNYILIKPGKRGDFLNQGATIPTRYTPDLTSVIADFGQAGKRLDNFLATMQGLPEGERTGEPGLFANLNDLIVDNRHRIDHILANMEQDYPKGK